MEFQHVLKEDSNSHFLYNARKKFQVNPHDVPHAFKGFKSNTENINPYYKLSGKISNEDSITFAGEDAAIDLSMLSLKDGDSDCVYYLPESTNLKNTEDINKWVDDMKTRRLKNRLEVLERLENFELILQDLSFDDVTGERYIIQSQDYRAELEMSNNPLGKNFLEDTNVNEYQRKTMLDYLFSAADALKTDRYTVTLAMSYADRYVKIKRKTMQIEDYKYVVVSCWFIACKYDLIYYPSMEDICEVMEISDSKIIIDFEVDVIRTIDFFLGLPIAIDFLRPLTLLKQRKYISHNVAKFFIELCLYSYDLAAHPSHIIAAASYCLAMALSLRSSSIDVVWEDLMKIYSGLDIKDIKPVISVLGKLIVSSNIKKDFSALEDVHSSVIEVLRKRHDEILILTK